MWRFLFFMCLFSMYGQSLKEVDFLECKASLTPSYLEKNIRGSVHYHFLVKAPIDTIALDAVAMQFEKVTINGVEVPYSNDNKKLKLFTGYQKGKNTLAFEYVARPKQTLYFVGDENDYQIWTQGQGKYTSHWLPSFNDVNEKVIFNLSVTHRSDYTVLANGVLQEKIMNNKGSHYEWVYHMQHPMSSYLVMMAIGKYHKTTENTATGTALEFYLPPSDVAKAEPTYRYSKQMFDYLEKEIGIPYPWQVYRQVPVKDFLYSGMENTTATIFSQEFVVDSIGFNDRNYVNVNAHELAHQWFGDLITAKTSEHHWLQEGFATFYALLAEKEVFGNDYFLNEWYEYAQLIDQAQKYDTLPVLNPKASSLTFYKKGAWALFALRTDIGEKKFRKAVKKYLKKHAFKNVDTQSFLKIVKKTASYDCKKFTKQWLENPAFDKELAMEYIQKNAANKNYFKLLEKYSRPSTKGSTAVNFAQMDSIMHSSAYYPLKKILVYRWGELNPEQQNQMFQWAVTAKEWKVRQALVEVMNKIPYDKKEAIEALLNDPSYVTREIALFRLWTNFKEDRENWVTRSQQWTGWNYNLKIAHLTLKIVSSNQEETTRQTAIDELETYMKWPYETTVRENAIETLIQLNLVSEKLLEELIVLSLHHKWQTVKFAKERIRRFISEDETRKKYIDIQSNSSKEIRDRIAHFLKETA